MQDRDARWCEQPELGKPRVLFMTSHFVTKMCQEAGGYDYAKVQRWTGARKLKRIGAGRYGGIRDVDKVVVPVHLGNHWVRRPPGVLCLSSAVCEALSGVGLRQIDTDSLQTCIAANFRDQQLEYYDSLGGVDRATVSSFAQWIADDWADKYGGTPPPNYDVRPSVHLRGQCWCLGVSRSGS